nr:hypothetical protein [Pandoravirus belohorizontensis]
MGKGKKKIDKEKTGDSRQAHRQSARSSRFSFSFFCSPRCRTRWCTWTIRLWRLLCGGFFSFCGLFSLCFGACACDEFIRRPHTRLFFLCVRSAIFVIDWFFLGLSSFLFF